MTKFVDQRPVAAQIYSLGLALRRSAVETWRRRLGLGATEWPIIATLHAGPIPFTKLCQRLSRDKGQVSRDINALARRGYVSKKRDHVDSRQIIVGLNTDNKPLVEEIEHIIRAREERLLREFSEEDRNTLKLYLFKLHQSADDNEMFEI